MTVTVDTAATVTHTVTATKVMNITGMNFRATGTKWATTASAPVGGSATVALNSSTVPGPIQVRGTINYVGGQQAGTYTGTYNLTASYN